VRVVERGKSRELPGVMPVILKESEPIGADIIEKQRDQV
jgi:hypothetical protein